jgi:hypothetical protein
MHEVVERLDVWQFKSMPPDHRRLLRWGAGEGDIQVPRRRTRGEPDCPHVYS